nr:hypothetical protein MFLOJ_52040 [Mycobacterium florentinum]
MEIHSGTSDIEENAVHGVVCCFGPERIVMPLAPYSARMALRSVTALLGDRSAASSRGSWQS